MGVIKQEYFRGHLFTFRAFLRSVYRMEIFWGMGAKVSNRF